MCVWYEDMGHEARAMGERIWLVCACGCTSVVAALSHVPAIRCALGVSAIDMQVHCMRTGVVILLLHIVVLLAHPCSVLRMKGQERARDEPG